MAGVDAGMATLLTVSLGVDSGNGSSGNSRKQCGAAEPRDVAAVWRMGIARAAANVADAESTDNACTRGMPGNTPLARLT